MAGASNYTAILAAIVALIQSGGGVNVYDYKRHVAEWGQMISLFTTGGKVHGWMVSRGRHEERWLTNVEVEVRDTYEIVAVYGCQDSSASEKTFQALLNAVALKFRADYTVSGTAEIREPLNFTTSHRMFGGILCHVAEGTVVVQERLQGGA